MLGVDVDDVADGDDRPTVGCAGLRVGGRRFFGGHARHIASDDLGVVHPSELCTDDREKTGAEEYQAGWFRRTGGSPEICMAYVPGYLS